MLAIIIIFSHFNYDSSLSVHNQKVKSDLVKNVVSEKYTEEQVKGI